MAPSFSTAGIVLALRADDPGLIPVTPGLLNLPGVISEHRAGVNPSLKKKIKNKCNLILERCEGRDREYILERTRTSPEWKPLARKQQDRLLRSEFEEEHGIEE